VKDSGFFSRIATLLKLLATDFRFQGRIDSASALLKLGAVRFAEMVFGITLHMHDAKLYISVGKETLGDGQQAGEIILHEQQHAAWATFQESA
jgi:hypothetical protein